MTILGKTILTCGKAESTSNKTLSRITQNIQILCKKSQIFLKRFNNELNNLHGDLKRKIYQLSQVISEEQKNFVNCAHLSLVT